MKTAKQLTSLLLCLSLLVLTLLTVSCGPTGSPASGSGVSLTYGKKYIYRPDVGKAEELQNYYVFNRNGTGDYKSYDTYTSYQEGLPKEQIYSYTIHFRYVVVEGTNQIACFFDSVEYAPNHTQQEDPPTTWATVFSCSKNVLLKDGQYGYYMYICENYLSQIPNFGAEVSTEE